MGGLPYPTSEMTTKNFSGPNGILKSHESVGGRVQRPDGRPGVADDLGLDWHRVGGRVVAMEDLGDVSRVCAAACVLRSQVRLWWTCSSPYMPSAGRLCCFTIGRSLPSLEKSPQAGAHHN
jgi:hypothetical protein